jgi:hypothetical protein
MERTIWTLEIANVTNISVARIVRLHAAVMVSMIRCPESADAIMASSVIFATGLIVMRNLRLHAMVMEHVKCIGVHVLMAGQVSSVKLPQRQRRERVPWSSKPWVHLRSQRLKNLARMDHRVSLNYIPIGRTRSVQEEGRMTGWHGVVFFLKKMHEHENK